VNIVKFRDLVSKVIVGKKSKASVVQDILGWLKPTIENGNTKVEVKKK
tara:strand:+ start:1013 stop:1156 length:144 start_codon:yes stop_codon:yes gene_type:complete